MSEAHAHDDHGHHVNYFVIFVALCVFTGISVGTEIVPFPNHASLVVTILAVACCKAFCVMAFFMHIKFEGKWIYLMLVPTTILALGLPLALMPDIGLPYYMRDTVQTDDYSRAHPSHDAGRDGGGEGGADHEKSDH